MELTGAQWDTRLHKYNEFFSVQEYFILNLKFQNAVNNKVMSYSVYEVQKWFAI